MRRENVKLRGDLEMCNLLRTALRALQSQEKERDQFVRWWIDEVNDLQVDISSYTKREIVRNGISLIDIGINA